MDATSSMAEKFFAKFIEKMDNSGHCSCKTVGKLLGYDEQTIRGVCILVSPWIKRGNDTITKDGLRKAKKRHYLTKARDISGRKLRTAICHECCARHMLVRSISNPRVGTGRDDFGADIREDDERYRKRIAEIRGLVEPKGYEVVGCPGAVASFSCHRCKCEIELPADFWSLNTKLEE